MSLRPAIALVVALVISGYRVARAGMSPAASALASSFVALVTVWSFPQWQVYGYQQPGIVAVVAAAALLAALDAASSLARIAASGLLVGAAIQDRQ